MSIEQDERDQSRIDALIQRERAARDNGFWDRMAACYHPDSQVEVSWFKGSGAEFAARSRDIAGGAVLTFHQMTPAVVDVRGDRALAETACTIHGIAQLDGAEIDLMSHTRLLWRVVRADVGWLISGMRAYYIKDVIVPVNPSNPPQIDPELYGSLRSSYRSIAYLMSRSGFPVRDDLAGIDRPETVSTMRAEEQNWLGAA